jgi:hypothetical protein
LATWTFTRGGTVTDTVWVRLTDDPIWARAGAETIAPLNTSPTTSPRIPAI